MQPLTDVCPGAPPAAAAAAAGDTDDVDADAAAHCDGPDGANFDAVCWCLSPAESGKLARCTSSA